MNPAPLKRKLELIWWCFTLIVVTAVLLPIILNTRGFPFYFANTLYIVIFITFSRYAFFLRHTWLARRSWLKLIIMAGSAITVFLLLMSLGDFSTYLEDQGLQTLVDHLPVSEQYGVLRYIQGEMIFFGIASAVSAVVLALRMLISVYRAYNHGTV
jgi:hypothetical protein